MPREVKELMVRELEDAFRQVPGAGCVLVNYQGMKADDSIAVRSAVREAGAQLTVVKNSMFAIAMERLGVDDIRTLLEGPVAVLTGENPVAAAKAARNATEACEAIQIRGGYVEGAIVNAAKVKQLAEIPGREELLSMIAGMLLMPLRRLLLCVLDRPRALLNGLEQLKEQEQQ